MENETLSKLENRKFQISINNNRNKFSLINFFQENKQQMQLQETVQVELKYRKKGIIRGNSRKFTLLRQCFYGKFLWIYLWKIFINTQAHI